MQPTLRAERRFTVLESMPTRNGTAAEDAPDPTRLHSERRSYVRWPVFWRARLSEAERDRQWDCLVLDFSPTGAKVRSSRPLAVGTDVGLRLSPAVHVNGRVVWAHGGVIGIEFADDGEQPAQLAETGRLGSALL